MTQSTAKRFRWPWLVVLLCLAAAGWVFYDWRSAAPPDALAKATYVGRQSCAACHQTEHQDWLGSHHDHAMELATEKSVRADFNNTSFERLGVTTRFFRDGDRYMVNTEGPDGKLHDYQIKYTFGWEPLQQYMVEFPDGRVQVLRVTWDTEKKRWFYVPVPGEPDQRIAHDDPFHWTGIFQNWNTTCAECHSTNLQKNYHVETDTYTTTFDEINVSCEECHGPASLHVKLASASSLFWDRNHGYGLAKLRSKDSTPQIEACAKCHARREMAVHGDFRPGRPLMDYLSPAPLRERLYHADGQIQDEVYVYGSFLQSRMHREGVRCSDCHNPHSLKLKRQGNALCTQCHNPPRYDTPAHHHHKPGTPGASCVECHMPATKYMVVDPRRDHSIRMPRPDLTVALGTPNACNGCHDKPEEDAQWAADKVVEWYGPKRRDDPHWGHAFAAAREGKPAGEALLIEQYNRATTPDIIKATAVELLAQYQQHDSRKTIRNALQHKSPMVRLAAVRAQNLAPDDDSIDLMADRMSDPIRSVRLEAARRIFVVPSQSLNAEQADARKRAMDDYEQAQELQLDRAAGHLNLGNLAMQQALAAQAARNPLQAVKLRRQAADEYRIALRLEPFMGQIREALAIALRDSGGEPAEVKQLYREELELLEERVKTISFDADTWYNLGRLRVLNGNRDDALPAFSKAAELAPLVYQYRLAKATALEYQYQQSGKNTDFEATMQCLREMEAIDPTRPETQQVYQTLMMEKQRREQP